MNTIRPEFVEFAPAALSPGVLYISERFQTALHMCPCGCGEKVITPLSPARWQLRRHDDTVSLHPSIGNWDYACRSHYYIRRNKIVWAEQFCQREIAHVKERDRQDAEREITTRNGLKHRTVLQRIRDVVSRVLGLRNHKKSD